MNEIEKSYMSKIVEEDTKINKDLTENILSSLKIRNSISVPHPMNEKDQMSLQEFVKACDIVAKNGYAVEASRALVQTYNFVMTQFDNVIIPRTQELLRSNITIAIKRRNLIREITDEVYKLRDENKKLWEANNKMEEKTRELVDSLKSIKTAFSEFRNSNLAEIWKKSFKSSVNNAFESFLISIEKDLQTISYRHNVEANIDKIVEAHAEMLSLKDEMNVVSGTKMDLSEPESEEVAIDRPPENFNKPVEQKKKIVNNDDDDSESEFDALLDGA